MTTDREIFEVYAKIVDANGTYSTLSGYPKTFDSKNYDNNIGKAYNRALGDYHEVLGTMYKRDDRQVQMAMILRVSDGLQIEYMTIGKMAPVEIVNEINEE